MKSSLKLLFKYICLGSYFILVLLLILESFMPGNVSSKQSNPLAEEITNKTGIGGDDKFIEPVSVKITNPQVIYNVGDIIEINYEVSPSNASRQSVLFDIPSDYSDIIEFESFGKVRFKKQGSAYVNVHVEGYENIKDQIKIEACKKVVNPTNIKIITLTTVLNVGKNYQLYVEYTPQNVTEKSIIWTSSDCSVATINEQGVVNCLKEGNVTIKATTSNDISTTIDFEVDSYEERAITKLELKPTVNFDNSTKTLSVMENEIIDLSDYLSIYPSDSNNKKIKWSVSNTDIVLLTPLGVIKGLYGDTSLVTVMVQAVEDESIKDEIMVKVNSVTPKLTIQDDTITLGINTVYKISLTSQQMPNKYELTYDIKDKSIASVDQAGIISGHKNGKTICIITCTSSDGSVIVKEISINVNIMPRSSFYLFVRKIIGHFGAFLVLALIAGLICILFYNAKPLSIFISLIIGVCLAGGTELIQLDIVGRTGTFKDVLIDSLGYIIGATIIFSLYYLIKMIKRRKNNNENKENKLNHS